MNIDGYKQTFDCHTHSFYSKDAVSSIEENVKAAVELGLKKIAITDHCFNHKYGIKLNDVKKIREEIERLKKIYPIEILHGVEANLISYNGDIDLTHEQQKMFDIVLLGLHKSARKRTLGGFLGFTLPNLWCKSKKHKQKITNSYVLALQKNKIDIVVHLKYVCDVNVVEIAKEAVKHGTLIELNNKHTLLTQEEVNAMEKIGAKFIVDSDAHNSKDVGKCPNVMEFLRNSKVNLDAIVNLEKMQ